MKDKIIDLITDSIEELDRETVSRILEIPPQEDMGDFAFPCFQLAKIFRKAPNMIAEEVAERIKKTDFVSKVMAMGPYVNFFIDRTMFVSEMLNQVSVDNYGSSEMGCGKTICIDYSSPNVAKNFHVGHLRTTLIGNSIYRIYKKLGYRVERINHLGDWGTQFGKLIVAYKKWGSKEAVEQNGISELMKIYVKFHEEAEKDDTLNDEARAWFVKMEQGDQEALSIWEWFKDISLIEYKRIYELLNVDFDSYAGESFYRDKTSAVVDELKEKGMLKESEGAFIVDLEEYDMTPCLIMKKTEVLFMLRGSGCNFLPKKLMILKKCIYVTGMEQKLHFAQVFKVVELMGYEWARTNLIHVPYGLVSLEGGKLSTRSGNIIYAEDILRESVSKIKEVIDDKNPDLQDKDEVAKMVGIGAIIFNDLYNQRIKDVTFSWDKIHSFDGETGPYVQYTYARAASVLRKTGITDVPEDIDPSLLTDVASVSLLKELIRFPEVVKTAAERLEPSVVARFVMSVAQAFNRFYHENQCNVEDEKLKRARVKLVIIAKKAIKDGLDLLGMKCPEQM